MCDTCGDNRFEIIEAYKKKFIEATNMETSPEEMAVIDYILFRFWQMGWLSAAKPEIIRCKDCKHRIENKHYGECGYINLKAMCELDTGDPFELSRNAEDDEWFCADGERRERDE